MTIKGACLAVPTLLAGWLAVLVTVTLLSDDAPAVVVLFPSAALAANLPEGVGITGATAYSVTLAAGEPRLALTLYQSGARLVLPSGLWGCAGE